MGDLSEEAIALANTVDDESEQSELWVYHVTAWDGTNRKWTANFPLKENPIDVLVSFIMICSSFMGSGISKVDSCADKSAKSPHFHFARDATSYYCSSLPNSHSSMS